MSFQQDDDITRPNSQRRWNLNAMEAWLKQLLKLPDLLRTADRLRPPAEVSP